MRTLLFVGGTLVVAAALGISAAGLGLRVAANPEGEPQVFSVEPGESLHSVTRRLHAQGFLGGSPLTTPRVLTTYARLRGWEREIKSGEYDVSGAQSPLEILAKLVAGEVKTHPVTLPDGLTIEESAERVAAAGIADAAAIVARARDPELARALDIEADSLEGYLFPETYRFRRGTPPDAVLRRMVEEFRAQWTDEDREGLAASGYTLHQAVTLASVVEKETGAAHERPRIAAVFANRLRKGMRLQSDPTVIYGILRTRGTFDGNLRRNDLREDTPYNTYTRGGIPPGPIASASMASIRAVLAPEDTAYLYFVSQNDGTHYFSRTLREHTNAVNRFQRGGRSR